MSNIFITLKKTCLGVLDRGKRDKNNEIGLKEGRRIEMSTTVLSIYAMHALLRFCIYLPSFCKTPQSFNKLQVLRCNLACVIQCRRNPFNTAGITKDNDCNPASLANIQGNMPYSKQSETITSSIGSVQNQKATQEQCSCKL